MAKVDPNLRQRVLALVARSSAGITAQELAAGVSLNPDDRQLLQCLNDLASAGLIVSDAGANPKFIALGGVSGDPTPTTLPPRSTPPAAPTAAPHSAPVRAASTTPPVPTAVIERATPATAVAPIPAAPAAAAPPAATDPDFAPMFDLAAPMVITALMTRSVATAALRMQALRNQKAGRVMADYVDYALVRLDVLTPADAATIGVTPDELLTWQQYFRS